LDDEDDDAGDRRWGDRGERRTVRVKVKVKMKMKMVTTPTTMRTSR